MVDTTQFFRNVDDTDKNVTNSTKNQFNYFTSIKNYRFMR